MSRIMAPSTRLVQGISTAAVSSSVRASSALAPEYAALLQGRNFRRDSSESSRTMFTTQNPNRIPRSTSSASTIYGARTIDNVAMPNMSISIGRRSASTHVDQVPVPILPDNYSHAGTTTTTTAAAATAGHFILAANPSNVEPASMLTSVKARHCVDEQSPRSGSLLRNIVDSLQEALAATTTSEPIPARS